jgi:hypothetical protein
VWGSWWLNTALSKHGLRSARHLFDRDGSLPREYLTRASMNVEYALQATFYFYFLDFHTLICTFYSLLFKNGLVTPI